MSDKVTDDTVVVSAPAAASTIVNPAPPAPGTVVLNAPTTTTALVVGGQRGLPGPRAVLAYVHSQALPAEEWLIEHGLSFIPNITVVDSAGSVVIGAVVYPDAVSARVIFSVAFSGTAYCS